MRMMSLMSGENGMIGVKVSGGKYQDTAGIFREISQESISNWQDETMAFALSEGGKHKAIEFTLIAPCGYDVKANATITTRIAKVPRTNHAAAEPLTDKPFNRSNTKFRNDGAANIYLRPGALTGKKHFYYVQFFLNAEDGSLLAHSDPLRFSVISKYRKTPLKPKKAKQSKPTKKEKQVAGRKRKQSGNDIKEETQEKKVKSEMEPKLPAHLSTVTQLNDCTNVQQEDEDDEPNLDLLDVAFGLPPLPEHVENSTEDPWETDSLCNFPLIDLTDMDSDFMDSDFMDSDFLYDNDQLDFDITHFSEW